MAKGSQLSQLKSALSQAGLNRQSAPGKKRKRPATSRETDKVKKAQKLQEIQQRLNPFDVKVTKLKHDVGGRKLKGVQGKPQQSKMAGIEQRKKTLLKEFEKKNHAGGIVDRRFGENDPTMTPEERMLERFTKERQRASRGAAFNLEDDEELTHYGQSLSKLDDFEEAGFGLNDEDDEDDGKIDRQTVAKTHFGGFEDGEDDAEEGEPRKKSKAEVMAEVIAKSKQYKYERQLQKQQDADTRHQLDQELDDIRGLLFDKSNADPASVKLSKDDKEDDQNYDQHVRELALDKRAKPKDRTKTEEELAVEAKEALEKAERKRLRRMMGNEDDSSDEEEGPSRKRGRRAVGGDDLEDDFQEDGEPEWGGLGAGLGDSHPDEGSNEEEEGSEGDDGGGSEDDISGDEEGSDDVSDDDDSGSEVSLESHQHSHKKNSSVSRRDNAGLPFTFSCPKSHDDFLSIVDGVRDEDIPTVIQRIRALHHPSLAVDNKFKLQALTGVLVDYILYITAPPTPNFGLIPSLIPHLLSLSNSYPAESARHFIAKLKLMQKNFTRGLSKGAASANAKTWPGTSELALLWTISYIWPTSDMNHNVISPARLLMASYLGLSRIRTLQDIASGLFLCTLFLRYEELSKRFVPEAPSFLMNALLHLCPHRFKDIESVPGSFPCPDFELIFNRTLRMSKKIAKSFTPRSPNLILLTSDNWENVEQSKMDLLGTVFELLGRYAEMYKSLEGFIELFQPVNDIYDTLDLDWASESLKAKHQSLRDTLSRLLKFARQSRRPLTLQAHKPIPIASYIPKFQSSSSSYLRKNDPDHERAAASKLRYQFKQERKGAIRELRKDAWFMASVQQKEQQEKDRAYTDRMNKVFSSMESERAEQKKTEREKAREKRRAGRK